MTDLTYKFSGVNRGQLDREVQHLRQNSSTFRALEAAAAAAGYTTIEIQMGAGLLPSNIADSTRINPATRKIRINSDASASWGVGGRQATVGEVIAHELAHAVVPPEYEQPGVLDLSERGREGMWVRRQAGQVAADLGLSGPNNADYLATRIPINKVQGCTFEHPRGDGAHDGVLFFDGTRGYNGIGSTVSPETGPQDLANSRQLATGEQRAVAPDDVRRLTRVNSSSSDGAFASGSTPVSYLPSSKFDQRFANGGMPPVDRPSPPANRPSGALVNEPSYFIPPPIWGLEDNGGTRRNDADEWFSRWVLPLLRQD